MSDKVSNEQNWLSEHPLFSDGILFSPERKGDADIGFLGIYNCVVDSIVLLSPHSSVEAHEAAHRVFGSLEASTEALRRLAGVNHVLLSFLIRVLRESGAILSGTNLDTLRVTNMPAPLIESILDRIRSAEEWFDHVFLQLLPIAEFAAIDFLPSGWSPSSSKESRASQERLVQAVGVHYAARLDNTYAKYGGFESALVSAWNAYKSIADAEIREELLLYVMSAIMQDIRTIKFFFSILTEENLEPTKDMICPQELVQLE